MSPFTYDFPRPALTADVVLFAGPAEDLSVLLIRRGRPPFRGQWALPGGFVDEGERVIDAARRELLEETGIAWDEDLLQVGTFGDPGRDPRGWTASVIWAAYVGREPPHSEWRRRRGGGRVVLCAWDSATGLRSRRCLEGSAPEDSRIRCDALTWPPSAS